MKVFDVILGQTYAVTTLTRALDEATVAGSYLFAGPDGVGKRTTAMQFAKALCGIENDTDPRWQQADRNALPDVRVVSPSGPSQQIRIGQLWPREGDRDNPPEAALLRDLSFEPLSSNKRVFVLLGAEGLNDAAANSLLKTLEEPASYAHFILTAPSAGSVLPTIASRCQVVPFTLLAPAQIEQALVDRFGVDTGPARFLAAYSEGSLGRAVTLARSPSLLAAREDLLDFARDLTTAPAVKALRLGENLRKLAPKLKAAESPDSDGKADGSDKSSREPLARALEMLATYYRDLLLCGLLGEASAPLVNADRRMEIAGASGRHAPPQWERAIGLIGAVRHAIERNANAQLATDTLLTQLTSL